MSTWNMPPGVSTGDIPGNGDDDDLYDGMYPSDEALRKIVSWPVEDKDALFEFVKRLWHWPEFATVEGDRLTLITGGWSGNESLIAALQHNHAVWMSCWFSSERGGRYVFEVKKKD